MENKFSVHINLIAKGKQVKFFSLSFRNRLMIGDVLTIDEIISGEMAYYKNQCNFDDNSIQVIRKRNVDELKKLGVNLKHITEVTKVYIHPIVNYSCVDFSADVSIVL
jgi:hypothetical protein